MLGEDSVKILEFLREGEKPFRVLTRSLHFSQHRLNRALNLLASKGYVDSRRYGQRGGRTGWKITKSGEASLALHYLLLKRELKRKELEEIGRIVEAESEIIEPPTEDDVVILDDGFFEAWHVGRLRESSRLIIWPRKSVCKISVSGDEKPIPVLMRLPERAELEKRKRELSDPEYLKKEEEKLIKHLKSITIL